MRKTVRLFFLLLAAILGTFSWWLMAPAAPDERTLQMTVVSPDGALEARVYSNFWTGALAVNGAREQTVELSEARQKSAAGPSRAKTVTRFDMETGAVVAVLWRDARHLAVVTSSNARRVGSLHAVDGISSNVLHYDPRNAREVACIEAFNRVAAGGTVATPPSDCSVWTGAST